jgi:glycosyltransferase involved in cell wall biosynthesis
MREIATNGVHAVLVPPRDVDGLAAGTLRLLDDSKLRSRLSVEARERARSRFDVHVAAKRFEELYEDVVRTKEERERAS